MEATPERNITIVKKAINGETFKSIGKEFNLSAERVRQITIKFIFLARSRNYLKKKPPGKFPGNIHDVRKHKKFWLKQIDVVAKKRYNIK